MNKLHLFRSSAFALKSKFLLIVFVVLLGNASYGQMSGTYTINPDGSGGTSYNTFTAAINALNTVGVNAPVIFNVAAGKTFNEKPPVITATVTPTYSSACFEITGISSIHKVRRNIFVNTFPSQSTAGRYVCIYTPTVGSLGATDSLYV